MKSLLKILRALSRPLGISSPEDIRGSASSKAHNKPSLKVTVGGRPSKADPPKNPASM
jgi:hypothetical protein